MLIRSEKNPLITENDSSKALGRPADAQKDQDQTITVKYRAEVQPAWMHGNPGDKWC